MQEAKVLHQVAIEKLDDESYSGIVIFYDIPFNFDLRFLFSVSALEAAVRLAELVGIPESQISKMASSYADGQYTLELSRQDGKDLPEEHMTVLRSVLFSVISLAVGLLKAKSGTFKIPDLSAEDETFSVGPLELEAYMRRINNMT